jgi:hypothetical protein
VAISVQVTPDCAQPASVVIRANGLSVTTLSAPFQGPWDTTMTADGTYAVTAEATISGSTVVSDPVSVVIDRTRPMVVSVTPALNDVGVSLAAPLKIVFSEPMLPSSVTPSAVSIISNAAAVPASASLSSDGATLTVAITDRSKLDLPAMLGAAVASTATDLAGNSLAVPYTWTWSVPAWITLDSLAADVDPVLAVGADLTPTVAYAVVEGGASPSSNLHVAHSNGTVWTQLGAPSRVQNHGANGYSVALDDKGQPTVAWSETGVTESSALFVHVASWDGAAWQTPYPPLDALTANGTNAANPRVKLDAMNRPVVAWRENHPDGTGAIFVARWSGTVWDKSFGDIGIPNSNTYDLALDATGNPIVGYFDTSSFNVGVVTWSVDQWTPSPTLASESASDLALASSGAPMIVAQGANFLVQKLIGGVWALAALTPVPVSATAVSPNLAATVDGSPVVGWLDLNSGKHGLARWTGKLWDLRFGLFGAGQGADHSLDLMVDQKDNVWTAWLEKGRAYVWMSNF